VTAGAAGALDLPVGALDLIATADLAGICRGRAVPAGSVGWVPANLAINTFATLADNPFGSVGDLRIHADPATAVPLPSPGAPVTLMLGDLRNPDGTDWACCPRTLLRRTLDELRAETGLVVRASFEQEFVLGSADRPGHPFAVQTLLAGEPVGSLLVAALGRAGLEPENWLPESGRSQWKVTVRPADGLAVTDRAIQLREMVRATALAVGRTASSPRCPREPEPPAGRTSISACGRPTANPPPGRRIAWPLEDRRRVRQRHSRPRAGCAGLHRAQRRVLPPPRPRPLERR
jgi:glutamine synthetase